MSEAVLAYNPLLNMTEKFIWATSHIATWTSEERTQLRDRPSYSVEYKFHIRSEADLAIMEAFYRVNQNLPVKVPMWSSPAYIENVTLGATLIPLSDVNPVHPIRYLLEVGMDVIVWLSPTVWESHTVTSIDAAGAHLATGLTRDYTHCYFLVNLLGFISASAFSKSAGSRKTWAFNFTCQSVYIEEYPFGSEFSTFDEKPLISSDFTVIAAQDSDTLSSPVGLKVKTPLEGITRRKWTASFKAAEFIEIATLKRKLAWFRGKARSLKFPFLELTPGATPLSVCLSEDSVTFVHSPRYRCSVSVGLVESFASANSVPFPNGFLFLTLYDWDVQTLSNLSAAWFNPDSPPNEGTGHYVDGHFTVAKLADNIYLVVASTGAYATNFITGLYSGEVGVGANANYKVGRVLSSVPSISRSSVEYLAPETSTGKDGLFHIYSNSIPIPW